MNHNISDLPSPPVKARHARRRIFLTVMVTVSLVILLMALTMRYVAQDAASAAPTVAETPGMTVAFGAARQQAWEETLGASGAITAWQETIISAQLDGLLLKSVHVNVGDLVTRGQVLARFDSAAPRAELLRLAAALEQAEVTEAQAELNRVRAESLSGSGALSDQEVLRYTTEAQAARANRRAARAAVAAQREQLRYVEVRAPQDGVIVARSASPGAVGGIGSELFRMIPEGRLEWRGAFTAAQLSRLAIGQNIELTLPDGTTAQARIRQTAPSLDPATRLGLIYADLTEPALAKAGMYVEGRVSLPERLAMTVPAASIVLRDGRHYLFTATPKRGHFIVRAREVRIGRRHTTDVEILEADFDLSRIVITGAGFLKDGDLVTETRPVRLKKPSAQGVAA